MILVTGATNFKGQAVVRRIVAEQHQVRCLLKPSRHEQQLPVGIPFSTVSASMDDLPALRTAMQDVTAIVHLTAHETIDRGTPLQRHLTGTANLITAAREVGIRRFIYVSRLGADRTSAYPIFHVAGETEAIVRESQLDYTILQPSLTFGPGDAFSNTLVMLSKTIPFILPIPDAGQSHFQPLCVADLAICVLITLEREDFIGKIIPIGGPEHFDFEQMVAEILAAAGVRKRLVHVRMPLIQWAVALSDALLPRNPTPFWWLDLLAVGSTTDLVTIPRHFDFEPHRLTDCLDYLRQKRPWRRDFIRYILSRHP